MCKARLTQAVAELCMRMQYMPSKIQKLRLGSCIVLHTVTCTRQPSGSLPVAS